MPRRLIASILFAAALLSPMACLAEEPIAVTVCDVLNDPAAYNHKLLKISGVVSRGFEDFTLSDESCSTPSSDIWIELGGRVGSQVMYCCGVTTDKSRPSPLVVEGIETSLVENRAFNRFQSLTLGARGYKTARATLVGRFFSGKKRTFAGRDHWVGFGHMGFHSLLVVQEVIEAHKE